MNDKYKKCRYCGVSCWGTICRNCFTSNKTPLSTSASIKRYKENRKVYTVE